MDTAVTWGAIYFGWVIIGAIGLLFTLVAMGVAGALTKLESSPKVKVLEDRGAMIAWVWVGGFLGIFAAHELGAEPSTALIWIAVYTIGVVLVWAVRLGLRTRR